MGLTSLPQGEEKTRRVRAMFDTIAPRYEIVNHLVTLSMDGLWRRRAVRDLRLPPGGLVMDLAAGTGDFCRELQRQGHRPVAVDLSHGMLEAGYGDYPRVQADATQLPFGDGCFDGATCGYGLRNFTDLERSLAEMARVIRAGGRIALLEVAEPPRGVLRWSFRIWFRHVIPAIGAALSDGDAYRYLPESAAYLPPADEVRQILNRAGFSGVNHRLIFGGLSQQWIATRTR